MKTNLINLLLVILIVLTSATTVNLITTKPQHPKHTQVKSFSHEYDAEEVGKYIDKKVKSGWILKEVAGANDDTNYSTWIVVMEKY